MTEKQKFERRLFELELKKRGYKRFENGLNKSLYGMQKKVTDARGIKYFINGYRYDFSDIPGNDETHAYTFEVQFCKDGEGKDQTIDIKFKGDWFTNQWRPITTLDEMEEFFENIWISQNLDYYEQVY